MTNQFIERIDPETPSLCIYHYDDVRVVEHWTYKKDYKNLGKRSFNKSKIYDDQRSFNKSKIYDDQRSFNMICDRYTWIDAKIIFGSVNLHNAKYLICDGTYFDSVIYTYD